MPANTADQQITLPILADAANAQVGFNAQTVPPLESRLVKRYVDVADRAARNPTPTAGEVCYVASTGVHFWWTGAIWVELYPLLKRKLANQIVNNSTVLVNDANLFLPLQANATYVLDGWLYYLSTTTADLKLVFTVPAGAGSNIFAAVGPATGAGSPVTSPDFAVNPGVGVTHNRGGASPAVVAMAVNGDVYTAGTAGNLQLQFAQVVADPSNTTMWATSWIRLQRVYN